MLPRNSKVSLQLKNECVLRTSSLQSANQFLSHQVEHTFHTLLIVFLGYAIDWGISPGCPQLAEMNGSKGGDGFYFWAGQDTKAII